MKFNQFNRLNDPYERLPEKQSDLLPKPPMNCFVISPFINGALDIRWDNPGLIPENSAFQVHGINLYRSFDSEGGPYTKVNTTPLGAGVYRDVTTNTLVEDEIVTGLDRGLNPQKEWRFKTKFAPVVRDNLDKNATVSGIATAEDIVVKVDNGDGNGLMEVPIYRFHSETGEIVLISTPILDPSTDRFLDPRLPLDQPGALTITYRFNTNFITFRQHTRIFYKLATVGLNSDNQLVESDLNFVKAINLFDQEKTDWIWKEAIRRNRWIMEQGGEPVKVFIRKWNGELCNSFDETHVTSNNDCPLCYGTNYVGGYEGPFDMIIAPPNTEKDIQLTDIGMTVKYNFETWTGPSPMLSKRDLIVRMTGERYSVGSINYVGQRGAIFQQMFTINQLDDSDFLYTLPIDGAQTSPALPWDTRTDKPSDASPVIPANKPIDRNYPIETGRTVTFEDIMY